MEKERKIEHQVLIKYGNGFAFSIPKALANAQRLVLNDVYTLVIIKESPVEKPEVVK